MDHTQLPVLFATWNTKSSAVVLVTIGISQKEFKYRESGGGERKKGMRNINNLVLKWGTGHGCSEEDLRE